MFGGFGALTARVDGGDDTPRRPPPPPTPLDFPSCTPRGHDGTAVPEASKLLKTFGNILRTGPTTDHFGALNVCVTNNVPIDQLLPEAYIPPDIWFNDPAKLRAAHTLKMPAPPSTETLSNGGPVPGHEAFYQRARELQYDSEDAFRTVKQMPAQPGTVPARVLHFRKFWDGLSIMAEYWDTSKDKYTSKESSPTSTPDETAMSRNGMASSRDRENKPEPLIIPIDPAISGQPGQRYTGRRRDTGRNMPGRYREDTLFAFIEPIAWCFRCRLEHASVQPKVEMQRMALPLPHNGNIYRTPRDPKLARKGIREGPLAALFCRDQCSFRKTDEDFGTGKQETLDLLKEVGLMLMLAQKRLRQGQGERVAGKDRWWATTPRWGGGPERVETPEEGDEANTCSGDTTSIPAGTSSASAAAALSARMNSPTSPGGRRRTRRHDKNAAWREMRPPAPTWERNVTYMQVGKTAGAAYDDIYLFSSVNHHVSILHARVYHRYCHFVASSPSAPPSPNSTAQQPCQDEWYKFELQRSRWFDLFSVDDRIEAMRGIWAVHGFLMADDGQSEAVAGR